MRCKCKEYRKLILGLMTDKFRDELTKGGKLAIGTKLELLKSIEKMLEKWPKCTCFTGAKIINLFNSTENLDKKLKNAEKQFSTEVKNSIINDMFTLVNEAVKKNEFTK